MIGIQGKQLTDAECQLLQHPLTAGVILFTRNYDNPDQITQFVNTLRETATNDLLIAVDHEGGRVQRFRDGFTAIPPMATFGALYDDKQAAHCPQQIAHAAGYVMAHEIAACDIDFSFAPVLDLQTDFSTIIGDRAFHENPDIIGELAAAFYAGMREAGTIGVGKHFPGHGGVVADSHLELPVSTADFATLQQTEIQPFKHLIETGIEAIMPAHILYSQVDGMPAGFSNFWLAEVLRHQLGFNGAIISDDLDMAGAAAFGGMADRVALAAKNCDLILLCNDFDAMQIAYQCQPITPDNDRQARLTALQRNKAALNTINSGATQSNRYNTLKARLLKARLQRH